MFVLSNKANALFIDQPAATEQALIQNAEGESFPLFTYDVQRAFGTVIEGTPTLVYLDRGSYYLVSNGKVPTTPTRVTFIKNAATGIDEEATLVPVLGNTTRLMVEPTFIEEVRLLSAFIDNGKTPYKFNLAADGTSNTKLATTGYLLELNALEVRDLVEDALLKAKAADVAGISATAEAALQFNGAVYTPSALGLLTSGIANGIWFGYAPSNVDGEVLFGFAHVAKNQIQTK